MLEFRNVRLRRGPQVLVDAANLTIFGGEKVGIVGRNGCGKSTLLALVRGELATDQGEFIMPPRRAVVSVLQELPATDATVLDYVLDGDTVLRRIETAISSARAADDGVREANLIAEFESLGGYSGRARAAETAVGLGFASEQLEMRVAAMSGGLQMRANLARALLGRPDILLLDEPTNHLDLDAVLWLESWLRRFDGTLLIVSHDREFLDAVVSRVVHIEQQRVRVYEGNYSAFESQAAAERMRVEALAERQARQTARVRSFVDRFRAKASKARQVQSRLKWLARLETVVVPDADATFAWRFESSGKLPQPLMSLDRVAAGYGTRTVIRDVRLDLAPGDRLGILGRNGAGKSTLMRLIAGELEPLHGERLPAADLAVGFFAQLELERFTAGDSALQVLTRRTVTSPGWNEQARRDHLGRFGFRGDRVFEPIARFSGGERARLALAALVADRPNLLLLDEPTNHLDFEMRHALMLALQEFAGAVVVVSHDRSLLRAVCNEFVVVRDGSLQSFDGDLEDYAAWLAAPAATTGMEGADDSVTSGIDRRAQRRRDAAERQRLAPLRNELEQLEQQMAALTTELREIEAQQADEALYSSAEGARRARDLAERDRAARRELSDIEARWLERAEELQEASSKGTEA